MYHGADVKALPNVSELAEVLNKHFMKKTDQKNKPSVGRSDVVFAFKKGEKVMKKSKKI